MGTDNLHVEVRVGDVVPDLVDALARYKDRIGPRIGDLSGEGEAGGDPDEVLLRDAQDVPSPLDDLAHVALLDTAVDLDVHLSLQPPTSHQGGELSELGEDRYVESLPAEPRVDRHDEEDVELVQALLRPPREGSLRL